METLIDIRNFAIGILKRIYWLLPSIVSDPFDIAERWFNMNYTIPSYIFWILLFIGYFVASFLTYRELRIQSNTPIHINWIISYKRRYRKLPLIPDFMSELVVGYTTNMTVSKNIQLSLNAQSFNRLLPSQQEKFLDLVEWLGNDRRDFLEVMRRYSPGN